MIHFNPHDPVDVEAVKIVTRIRRDLRLDERQEVHERYTSQTPTDPETPAAIFRAWLLQQQRLLFSDD